jgi:hypothetical protein
VLQVQLGKAVGGALGRGLLQHEAHVVLLGVVLAQEVHVGDDLEAEAHGLFGVVQFLAHVVLNHFVEAHHAHQEGGPVHAQVGLAVQVHGQQGQRAGGPWFRRFLMKSRFCRWAWARPADFRAAA